MDINQNSLFTPTNEEKNFAIIAHAGGLLFGFIPALIIWLMKKDTSAYIERESKKALNFQITITIAMIISYILVIVVIGLLLIPIIWVVNVIFCILSAIKTANGESYKYPFSINLVK